MKHRKHVLVIVLLGALTSVARGNDIVTSFEFTDLTGQFTLGTLPRTAVFTGGEAKSALLLHLYHTGFNSWMVDSGNTGTIELSVPPDDVDLFFKDENPSVQSVLTVFDTSNAIIAMFQGSSIAWTQVAVGSNFQRVSRITLENNGTGYTVIDDLAACAGLDVGTGFCSATANSTGFPGTIAGLGSNSLSANDLVLCASQVPQVPGIGIFIAGPTQAQIPFFDSFLCVSPSGLQRINQVTPPLNNKVTQGIDYTGVSTGTVPLNVAVGVPYQFQYWFRDPLAGMSGANFTDGLSITVTP